MLYNIKNKIEKLCVMAITALVIVLSADMIYANDAVDTAANDKDAVQLGITVAMPAGQSDAYLKDDSYSTKVTVAADSSITVTASDPMYGLYIEWYEVPQEWTLQYNDKSVKAGTNGFLHEYVALEGGASEVTLSFASKSSICNITAYSDGKLPSDVQTWKPHCEQADMLVLSAHADDEVLFLGGVIAEYAGNEGLAVQVVYFSTYTTGTVIREHEKLDGLWAMGVKNYPEMGTFDDIYADGLASAEKTFGYDKTLAYVVEMIRKYKPLVCVTQDTNGEYGHGTHMLISKAMQEAVTVSMDNSIYPESAATYGVYDVPKTYIHLYGENQIHLDCRKPLENMGGQNAVEVASAAYKQHVSQQWCWFYVSDTYEYSIAEFGMCRSTVGADTGNDMMEHLESYAAKAQRLENERIEAESKAAQESLRAEEESRSIAESQSEKEASPVYQVNKVLGGNAIVIIIVVIVLVVVAGIVIRMIQVRNYKKKKQQRKLKGNNKKK